MNLKFFLILKFIFNLTRNFFKNVKQEYNLYIYSKKNNCSFGQNINFLGPLSNISIGKNTTINSFANFRFKSAKINIGDDCLIARNVTILTQSYEIDNKEEISLDDMIIKNVYIGNNVLLGSNVVIMPGVSIGNNSVIGAGSVVTKNIGDLEVWAGVPAKFIRKRNINNEKPTL